MMSMRMQSIVLPNVKRFYEHLPVPVFGDKPEVQGLLAYTGELPKDARDVAKGFKPHIKFKKF
jgi:hypothetical protein